MSAAQRFCGNRRAGATSAATNRRRKSDHRQGPRQPGQPRVPEIQNHRDPTTGDTPRKEVLAAQSSYLCDKILQIIGLTDQSDSWRTERGNWNWKWNWNLIQLNAYCAAIPQVTWQLSWFYLPIH